MDAGSHILWQSTAFFLFPVVQDLPTTVHTGSEWPGCWLPYTLTIYGLFFLFPVVQDLPTTVHTGSKWPHSEEFLTCNSYNNYHHTIV